MQTLAAKHPESYFQIVARSLKLYRASFRHAIFFALLISIIFFIPRLICDAVGQNVFLASKHINSQQVLFVVMYIACLWFFAAMLWAIHCMHKKIPENFFNDIKTACKRILYVVVAAILLLLIGLAAAVCSYLLHFIFTHLNLYSSHIYWNAFLLFIVLFARVGIAVYISVLFYFYFPLIVVEKDGILLALITSARLVWGYALRTLYLIMTPWLVYLIVILGIRMLFDINFHVYFLPYEGTPNFYTTGLHILLLALFIPWVGSIILVQLQDLELRKKAVTKKK